MPCPFPSYARSRPLRSAKRLHTRNSEGLARDVLPRVYGHIQMTYRWEMMDHSRHIAAADFKANCLRLMDEVARQRRPIIITKRGKPVAKLVPVEEQPLELFGYMAGTAKICGDIVAPIDVEWEADATNI